MTEPGEYQSLYRRFRPQRFDQVLGQEHVALALRNAVRDGRVGHAYLFSGPRGTGKTSSARILAMALNCADPRDGEPCGVCGSCVEIARGTSLDVHELDAASNNGVEAMRDLVARAALGTPGRWKVYIVDEVHMLSAAASNALLKTLEEPPPHVVFVLATTDPQKVLPTIRSRTQHFEFRLLGPHVLAGLLETVRNEAGLDVPDGALDAAVRRGRGSARDALSALDQVAAGGRLEDDAVVLRDLADALARRDPTGVLVASATAAGAGRDALRLTGDLVEYLREAFLAAVAPALVTLSGGDRDHVTELASEMGLATLVRCIEVLGEAEVSMRDAADPRVHLEVALLRLVHPAADDTQAAMLERIEQLERLVGQSCGVPSSAALKAPPTPGDPPATPSAVTAPPGPPSGHPSQAAPPVDTSTPPLVAAVGPQAPGSGPALARRSLGAVQRQTGRQPPSGSSPSARSSTPAPTPAATPTGLSSEDPPSERRFAGPVEPTGPVEPGGPAGSTPSRGSPGSVLAPTAAVTRDDLVQAWGDRLLSSLPQRARARFRVGRFLAVEDGAAVFALPNDMHRQYCEEVHHDVQAALTAHFGVPVPLVLVVDPEAGEEAGSSPREGGTDVSSLRPADGPEPWPGDSGVGSEDEHLLDRDVLAAETEPAGAPLGVADRLKQAFPGAEEV